MELVLYKKGDVGSVARKKYWLKVRSVTKSLIFEIKAHRV